MHEEEIHAEDIQDLLVCLEPLLRGLGHADPGSLVQALQELEGGYQGEQRLINCIGSRLRTALAAQLAAVNSNFRRRRIDQTAT